MFETTIAPFRRSRLKNFADARADELSVANPASPSATSDADVALAEAVGEALRATGYAALGDIQVEICNGIAVLWGCVTTYHQKQLAQAVAQRVDGVRGIANGLDVVCRP